MATKDFRQDLAAIRRQLEDQHRQSQEAARVKHALEAERLHNNQLFRKSMGDVVTLVPPDRAARPRPQVLARQLQTAGAVQVASVTALSDGPDGIGPEGIDESAPFTRDGIDQRSLRRLQRGDWPVRGRIDLHGMTRDQARHATDDFLRNAVAKGWRCVRLIHGKGLGSTDQAPVLKMLVRRWLRQSAPVLAYTDAPAAAGGSGALLVLLKTAGTQPTAHP